MSWPAVCASGPSWPHPVILAKISRGLTAAQSSGPMPSRSQVPGRNASITTAASAGICNPPGLRTRTTSAPRSASTMAACGPGPMPPSSSTFTPASGPVSGTLLDLQHLLTQALGGGLHATLHRALEHESRQRDRQVDADVEPDLGPIALGCQRVGRILGLQLTRTDQGPTDHVAGPGVLDDLFVGDARGLDLHLDSLRPAVVVRLKDLGLLILRRPRRRVLDVGDDVEDLLRTRFDHDLTGITGSHGATIAGLRFSVMEIWELAARERIRDTLARYNWSGAALRLDDLAQTFCEDGVLEIRGFEPLRGRSEIVALLGGVVSGPSTAAAETGVKRIVRHNVTNVRFSDVTPQEARVAC